MCKEKAQCGFKAYTYFGFHELSDLDRGSLPAEPGAGSAASACCSRTRKAGRSARGGSRLLWERAGSLQEPLTLPQAVSQPGGR